MNMSNNDMKYNASGCRDVVAERAIKNVDRTPHEVTELVDVIKKISGAYGYNVEGRIAFRNKKTNNIYR